MEASNSAIDIYINTAEANIRDTPKKARAITFSIRAVLILLSYFLFRGSSTPKSFLRSSHFSISAKISPSRLSPANISMTGV